MAETLQTYTAQRLAAERHVRNTLSSDNIMRLFGPNESLTAREVCHVLEIPTTRYKYARKQLARLVGEGRLITITRLTGSEPGYSLAPNQTAESEDNERRRQCIVCRDRDRSVLMIPCRHLCLCDECNDRLTDLQCPVCREVVVDTIKVLFA